ncbi:uncharacterized protein B0I36DRAFT_236248 [Microdochium trichocladiopsis]|uniref:SMP-30/Gluconolactonase/LRE-like region domain-containing protein n=1 Tax=Microdochium trichocladiopsis TaxID=1682393 RepID=A0A9P9BYU0_9PEZI|nr:uncharacterized protein B0I36DRAFT_236248 [Microdochium trichocladiopsis]KAH7038368.1 hypothetical protein B0I36DRAFT_236248 [Microdochium trichocladiopsis]
MATVTRLALWAIAAVVPASCYPATSPLNIDIEAREASLGLLIGPSVVEVPASIRNVFPAKDFNRPVTQTYWQTEVRSGDPSGIANHTLRQLGNATFLAFDRGFYDVLGIKDYRQPKKVETIFTFPAGPSYANRMVHDGTVYSPECNCIFAAELYPPKPGFSMQFLPWVWRTNLNGTAPVTEKVYPDPPLTIANGAYYHDGAVYWQQEGNYTTPGGIVRMDPLTLKTAVVLNNYLGHRFNSPNDVVMTKRGVAYFTDGYYGFDNFNDTIKPEMANGVWRWDSKTGNVRMVAGAGTGIFTNPNGVALNREETTLYITARGFASADADGNRNIYQFDLTANQGRIAQPLLFAYSDAGFTDGIKTDKEGRVYGGVTGSVDIFDPQGTLLGKINVAPGDTAVNMAWVKNWLYIYGRDKIYRVQLNTVGSQML